jgi:hypothetical protein
MRAAVSTQVFLVFLRLQANAEMVPKFQVATVCFPCSPPELNSSKLSPNAVKAISPLIPKIKIPRPCLKPLPPPLYRLYFHFTLIRRTSGGRSLGTSEQNDALPLPPNIYNLLTKRIRVKYLLTCSYVYYSITIYPNTPSILIRTAPNLLE